MSVFYPNAGALVLAEEAQALLAASMLRLFKSTIIPNVSTTLAELEADEADFTGYAAGGIEITAFFDPVLYPLGGASISAPTVQFQTDDPTTVGNVIGGWWLETAGGNLFAIGTFPNGQPMQAPNQGLPLNLTLVFGSGLG